MNSRPGIPPLGRAEQIDLLMKEYGFIKAEMQTYIGLFHRHTNFIPILLPIIVGAGTAVVAVLARSNADDFQRIVDAKVLTTCGVDILAYQLLALLASMLIVTLGLFSSSASISYMYIIELLARRVEVIERRINALSGVAEPLLYWEIGMSPRLIRLPRVVGLWAPPSSLRILWSYVGFVLVVLALVAAALPLLGPPLAIFFWAFTAFGILLQCRQYFLYMRRIVPQIAVIAREPTVYIGP